MELLITSSLFCPLLLCVVSYTIFGETISGQVRVQCSSAMLPGIAGDSFVAASVPNWAWLWILPGTQATKRLSRLSEALIQTQSRIIKTGYDMKALSYCQLVVMMDNVVVTWFQGIHVLVFWVKDLVVCISFNFYLLSFQILRCPPMGNGSTNYLNQVRFYLREVRMKQTKYLCSDIYPNQYIQSI